VVDFNATLTKFFEEIIKYLEKRAQNAKTLEIRDDVMTAIAAVRRVMAEPKRFADYNVRVKAGLEAHAVVDGFMAGTRDNSVFLLYNGVLWAVNDLYSPYEWEREQAQQKLLNAKKSIEYKNSTNLLKSLYYPFLPEKMFAEKVKQK